MLPSHIPIGATDRVREIVKRGAQVKELVSKRRVLELTEFLHLTVLLQKIEALIVHNKQGPAIAEELELMKGKIKAVMA